MEQLRTSIILVIVCVLFIFMVNPIEGFLFNFPRGPINLDGKFKSSAPELRYAAPNSALGGGPLLTAKNKEECTRICKNQTECSLSGSKCTSSYNEKNQDCLCSFKIEGFTGLFDHPYIESTPSWRTEIKEWTDLVPKTIGKWEDTKIENFEKCAISFWLYVDKRQMGSGFNTIIGIGDDHSEQRYMSIYSFTPGPNQDWGWYVNDTIAWLHLSCFTENSYEGFVAPITYDKPLFCVISTLGLNTNVYINGVLSNYTGPRPLTRTGHLKSPPADALLRMRQTQQGQATYNQIKVKDLYFYNSNITQETVTKLYDGLKSTQPPIVY